MIQRLPPVECASTLMKLFGNLCPVCGEHSPEPAFGPLVFFQAVLCTSVIPGVAFAVEPGVGIRCPRCCLERARRGALRSAIAGCLCSSPSACFRAGLVNLSTRMLDLNSWGSHCPWQPANRNKRVLYEGTTTFVCRQFSRRTSLNR